MGELSFGDGGWRRIQIWGEGGLLGGFSQVGGINKFSAGGKGLPPSTPVGKLIYIYIYIYYVCIYIYICLCIYHSANLCTDHLANHKPAIVSVPRGTEKLNKLPQANKKP